MKIKLLLILLFPIFTYAQPFNFKSKGTAKPIVLSLSWHNMGKGASVMYMGKTQPITLKIKSYTVDSSERANGAPDEESYKWLEVYNGKITGEYGVKVMQRNIYDMYYIGYSDHKRYDFDYIENTKPYDGKDIAFLHDIQLNFYTYYQHQLTIKYKNGEQQKIQLDKSPKDRPRSCVIKDYNFDGLDDVAFIYIDEQGKNVIYNIFIYSSKSKKFTQLVLPDLAAANKFTLYNLKINEPKKTLTVAYINGSERHLSNYKFDKNEQLILQ